MSKREVVVINAVYELINVSMEYHKNLVKQLILKLKSLKVL